jgi:hypothetical protein
MLGKREGCNLEVLLFSIPTLLIGAIALRRGYVLRPWAAGATLGVAAGAVPALVMQFACMYEPRHILLFHLAPVVLVGVLGIAIGYTATIGRRRSAAPGRG